MKWTKEQEQAIVEDGSNILVAAAAGSGKTAVLVERMIQAITNKKIDIDSILIVTFTNAAASEMRERIVDAIYKKLEENPEDKHLQHQLLLLNRASICTIHSFCLEVIRNHFYETQESANFQIGDATEMELLKQEVMEEMFTEKYEKKDEEFLSLLEMYTSYDDDTALKELLFTVYQFIQSAPFPKQMLKQFTEELQVKEGITDFKDTKWGKVLLQEVDSQITGYITELNGMIQQMERLEELDKFTNTLREDSNSLEKLKMSLSHFDTAYQMAQSTNFNKWPVDRKVESEYKEIAKKTRDAIKKKFAEIQEKLLCCNSATAIQELQHMYPVMKKIQKLVFEFTERFTKAKREKNKIDFNDIEHLALQLLLKPKEDGTYEKTKIAEEYTKKFTQIAIDEYQDSNLVQENILKAISNGHNIFMVGDVKQSIYRFRQARPQLFLEKYRSYKLKEEQKQGEDVKIPLFKNFRSRKNILDTTNLVFESIMSEKLGEIEYHLIGEEGPDHNKSFSVELTIRGRSYGKGKGRTKKAAEQQAAAEAAAAQAAAEQQAAQQQQQQQQQQAAGLAAGQQIRLTESTNIQTSMSETAPRLALAYAGEYVTVQMSYAEGWTKVTDNGQEGYVRTDILQAQVQ